MSTYNFSDYKTLSKFETLDAFNEHYRKITYTYADLLEQKPSYKAVLKELFKLGAKTLGVAFPKRETLAAAAGVSVRSVANFIKDADIFGIRVEKQCGRLGKRFGGYAHNVFIFDTIAELSDLPCTPSCTASLPSVDEAQTQAGQGIDSPSEAPNQDSFKQDSPSELNTLKTYIQDVSKVNDSQVDKIQNELDNNAIEIVAAKQNISENIVSEFSCYYMNFEELNNAILSIKRTMNKHGYDIKQYEDEIKSSIRAFFPTFKEFIRGEWKYDVSPIGYLCGIIKNKISQSIDESEENDFIENYDSIYEDDNVDLFDNVRTSMIVSKLEEVESNRRIEAARKYAASTYNGLIANGEDEYDSFEFTTKHIIDTFKLAIDKARSILVGIIGRVPAVNTTDMPF